MDWGSGCDCVYGRAGDWGGGRGEVLLVHYCLLEAIGGGGGRQGLYN